MNSSLPAAMYLIATFFEPLDLKEAAVDGLVAFLEALAGEGYQDQPPATFPQ